MLRIKEKIKEILIKHYHFADCYDVVDELLNLHSVSEMFGFAEYLYGNFDYHDNTNDGDIYIHKDSGLKYTRDKIYQQWMLNIG